MEQVHKTLPKMGFNTNINSGINKENTTPAEDETVPDETQFPIDEDGEQSTIPQETESYPEETTPSHENDLKPDVDMDATGATGGDMDVLGGNGGGDIDAPTVDVDTDRPNETFGGDVDASVDAK